MPILRVNAYHEVPVPHRPDQQLKTSLREGLSAPGPVIILVHGFKFSPFDKAHCPHKHIFALSNFTDRKVSWPRGLGFGKGHTQEGLCIAFGWSARGWIWGANARAKSASVALAALIRRIRKTDPTRAIHLIGHSLGAKVSLHAMAQLAQGDLTRVILLNGAAFQDEANRALKSPAGQRAEVLNVTSRENLLYDWTLKALIRPHAPWAAPLRAGLRHPNALNLPIDRDSTRAHLAWFGVDIAPSSDAMCHWSTYTRKGVWDLYARVLRTPEATPLHLLAPRRTSAPRFGAGLPLGRRVSS